MARTRRPRTLALAAVSLLTALGLAAAPSAARTSAQAATSPVRHVVVIYLENHSFDNLLGYWCDAAAEVSAGRCEDASGAQVGMPSSVTLSNGAIVTPGTTPDVVPVVRHETIDQQNAIDGGKMNGWEKIPGCGPKSGYACVSGYQPGQVPNLTRLAQDFAISDETFSMQDSPSWFGHMYAVAATTDGFTGNPGGNPVPAPGVKAGAGWGCDSNRVAQWARGQAATRYEPSCVPDPALTFNGAPLANGGAFERTHVPYVPTILDRLGAAGLPWRLYGAQCATETTAPVTGLETCAKSNTHMGYIWSICPTFAECLYSQASGMAPDSQFITDASSGTLPAFSVVTPGSGAVSEHNGFSMTQGDNWLGSLVSAVMNGPEWSSTAVFITWDDCGCFYDQVRPGTNPDGTPQGPRVPLVIVSPYARPGFTDTTPATFASILKFTEETFGLTPLGTNDGSTSTYDFSGAFNYGQTRLRPVRMVTRPVPKNERIDWAQTRQVS